MSGSVDSSAAVRSATRPRPYLWSIRRELWENRSLFAIPVGTAVLVLLGFLVGAWLLLRTVGADGIHDAAPGLVPLTQRVGLAMIPLFMVVPILGLIYCLDALYADRRDRSILFWKSLPVSDTVTVLAKASIPLWVLPLFAFFVMIATQVLMLLLGTVVLLACGVDAGPWWTESPLPSMTVIQLYGVFVLALWHAPIYGWLLLASAWARRSPALWAALPVLAILVFERLVFGTTYALALFKHRVFGSFSEAFDLPNGSGPTIAHLDQLEPLQFLASPGLWSGLALTAVFLAAAIWLRRHREPL